MPNALAQETSPYLRQHAENPVDWRPWGAEALAEAARRGVPLLVSIGYSACHWCHVMERESFCDPDVAAVMNERFVCIKVDREERPDVDAIYLDACQAMTGQAGWPLHVFCTPDQVPFFAGTYFPPGPGRGMASWRQVLDAVAEAWTDRRDEIEERGAGIAAHLLGGASLRPAGDDALTEAVLQAAVERLRDGFDSVQGGWGDAPKFPAASTIELLLRRGETRMSGYTLRAMASGGIHDQLAGGFARYSVDASWTVPHFEKMLYDNALLARAYLHGAQRLGDPALARVCETTLDWALDELRGPEGGFCSALDADSDGVEGAFYVWTLAELEQVLGAEDAAVAAHWFGVTAAGNFRDPHHPERTGMNVLEDRAGAPEEATAARIRARLLGARAARTRPATDTKRLAAWNALVCAALAESGAVLGRAEHLDAAIGCARFVLSGMRAPDGRLLRTSDGQRAQLPGYLDDHAAWIEALVVLHEATFDHAWLAEACALADHVLAHFHDPEHGGFFATADDAEALLVRRKDLEDHPVPAGGSSAALGLLRLAALTGRADYEAAAVSHLRLVAPLGAEHPGAFAHTLQALDEHLRAPREVAIVGPPGPDFDALVAVVREDLRPGLVLTGGDGHDDHGSPLLAGRGPVDGRPAAYVCERFACRAPIVDPQTLRDLIAT